jgi:hypothetical protein
MEIIAIRAWLAQHKYCAVLKAVELAAPLLRGSLGIIEKCYWKIS